MTPAATKGWRRPVPGSYTRGNYSIRRLPDEKNFPGRPWVLYAAQLGTSGVGGAWGMVGRYHTLRNAQIKATRRERDLP